MRFTFAVIFIVSYRLSEYGISIGHTPMTAHAVRHELHILPERAHGSSCPRDHTKGAVRGLKIWRSKEYERFYPPTEFECSCVISPTGVFVTAADAVPCCVRRITFVRNLCWKRIPANRDQKYVHGFDLFNVVQRVRPQGKRAPR